MSEQHRVLLSQRIRRLIEEAAGLTFLTDFVGIHSADITLSLPLLVTQAEVPLLMHAGRPP